MVVLFKKMITYVLVAFISFLTMATSAEATNVRTVRIPIISNGKVLQTDTSPIMVNNRILVPFRAIAQSTGANVFGMQIQNK